jgi:hypothetical protein
MTMARCAFNVEILLLGFLIHSFLGGIKFGGFSQHFLLKNKLQNYPKLT